MLKRKKYRLDLVIYDHPFSVLKRGSGILLVVLLVEGKQARKERRPHLHTDLIMEATAMRKVERFPRDPIVFYFFKSTTVRPDESELAERTTNQTFDSNV